MEEWRAGLLQGARLLMGEDERREDESPRSGREARGERWRVNLKGLIRGWQLQICRGLRGFVQC